MRFILAFGVLSFLAGCDLLSKDDGGDPNVVMTESISFSGGTMVQGAAPAPTNNPSDPRIGGAPSGSSTIYPGAQSSMDITFSNVPPNTPFDVNIQFGDANNHISIPINPSITGGATAGTLNLPFDLSDQVCNNLDDIQHQIACYETVSVGGQQVSQQQARQLVLACDTGDFSGPGSYCAYNYPKLACDEVRSLAQASGIRVAFVPGRGPNTCNAFGRVDLTQNFGFLTEDEFTGPLGACVVSGIGGGAQAAKNGSGIAPAEMLRSFIRPPADKP